MTELIEKIGFIAAISVPLFNIPLIIRIIQRKSSDDISLTWVLGVWICFILMLPSGLISDDIVWRAFNIANITFFTVVVIVTLRYRFVKKGTVPFSQETESNHHDG